MEKLCIISHSGGLDSSTLIAKAIEDNFKIITINMSYGQKHDIEVHAQQEVFNHYKELNPDKILRNISIDLNLILKNELNIFQKNRDNKKMQEKNDLEFYTPNRNLLFSVISATVGEIIAFDRDIKSISIGLGIHKHSDVYLKDYWDITPEFIKRLQYLFDLNDCIDVNLYAPYKDNYKEKIIQDVKRLNVPYKKTWTCYSPIKLNVDDKIKYKPCLKCEACLEREKNAKNIIHDINDYEYIL